MSALVVITGMTGTKKYTFAEELRKYLCECHEDVLLLSQYEEIQEHCAEGFLDKSEFENIQALSLERLQAKINEQLAEHSVGVCVGEFNSATADVLISGVPNLTSFLVAMEPENFSEITEYLESILASDSAEIPHLYDLLKDDAVLFDDKYCYKLAEDFEDRTYSLPDKSNVMRIRNAASNDIAYYAIEQLIKLHRNKDPCVAVES